MEPAPTRTGPTPADYSSLALAVGSTGLTLRGAFHPKPEDEVPRLPDGSPTLTLALLGFIGKRNWGCFNSSAEATDGETHPLDRWSRRMIDQLARSVGAAAIYPFPTDKPPYFPFQRWALAAEAVHPSPIKILIHPDWGLWHSYRGALLFSFPLELPQHDVRPSPCKVCAEKPCLSGCPAGAFEQALFSVQRCLRHLQSAVGSDCLEFGCRARRSCPVGAEHRYEPVEARLHMGAFLTQHSCRRGDSTK